MESSVIVGRRPVYYRTHTGTESSPYHADSPLTSLLISSHVHTNTCAHGTHNTGPAHHCWGAPLHSDEFKFGQNKKEGLSAESRQRTVVLVIVGGELLLRRGMIFLLLYVRGLYLTWSWGCMLEEQLWAHHKPGLGGLQNRSNFSSTSMHFSAGFLDGKWRMWGVICGGDWSKHRLYFSLLF